MTTRRSTSTTEGSFAGVRFRHPWRTYQKRVLDILDDHLDDNHLHVIAPPGSGKTVLGLEALRRLGRPALVLAPTITVREQWLERFRGDFDAGGTVTLSSDLSSLGTITASTYQALASFYRSGEASALERSLLELGVTTLVVDEAHHLRATWWRCLENLVTTLEQVKVLALTATPPYDAPQAEWNRYADFCGPVDEEIGVPELVQDGNLCPHQDYVYLSFPSGKERETLDAFHDGVTSFVSDLALDMDLARLLGALPALERPRDHMDEILARSELFLSLVVYLNGLLHEAARPLLGELGLKGARLPEFDRYWAQVMVDGLLRVQLEGELPEETASGDAGEESLCHRLEALRDRLGALGALERGRIHLHGTQRLSRLLRQSRSKLESILRIAELESLHLGNSLRLVILTDHIHEEELKHGDAPEADISKLGVVPIFESLRRLRLYAMKLAVLTGRLVIVPRECKAPLLELARDHGLPVASLSFDELAHTREFLEVRFPESSRRRAVPIITRLFSRGDINTIVGTASLLGEGWDAPSINTLILASVIGSFVTSNQMRGRAIRSCDDDPFKTAHIWHLACAEPTAEGGGDIALLRRRFEAFVGPSLAGARIESGLDRMAIEGSWASDQSLAEQNAATARRAARRNELSETWQDALGVQESRRRLVKELRTWTPRLRATFLRGLGVETGLLGWLWRWWAEHKLARMARAVIDALYEDGRLPRGAQEEPLEVEVRDGVARIRVPEASHLEQSLFVRVLAEVFDPLASPRYLLAAGSHYFAVPRIFGENRSRADRFRMAWKKHVGRAHLVYTRNADGKRHLIRAKEYTLLRRSDHRTEILMRWA